jgi:hypothetical protein
VIIGSTSQILLLDNNDKINGSIRDYVFRVHYYGNNKILVMFGCGSIYNHKRQSISGIQRSGK